jgi:hypothetical protein
MPQDEGAGGETAATKDGTGRPSIDRLLAIGAIVVAILARTLLLADKPFWRDEAWVALLVDDPMRAAAEGRAAPLGFLLLANLTSRLPVLSPEVAYRLLPLAAGIALVPLLGKLAASLGASRRVAIAAMWLAAGLQPFLYYSRELKSYGLDALLAVLAPLLGLAAFGGPSPSRASRAAFVVLVVVAPWVSFGGIFAVGALLAWGWLAGWWREDRAARDAWILASLAFAASFLAVYVVALGNQANDTWMHAYWKPVLRRDDSFLLPLRFVHAMGQYVTISGAYLFRGLAWAALALAVVGAWTWPRRHRSFLVFQYAMTAAVCAAAVVSDHYLLVSGRLLLVAAPLPLLAVAGGLHAIGRPLGARLGSVVALGLPIALALSWSAEAVAHRVGPYRTNGADFFRLDVLHDVNRMVERTRAEAIAEGLPLLVSRRCTYAFQFYDRGRWPKAEVCAREDHRCDAEALRWIAQLKGKGLVLMMEEETGWFSRQLDKVGANRRVRTRERGVRLWEVERKPKSSREAAARGQQTPREGESHGGS